MFLMGCCMYLNVRRLVSKFSGIQLRQLLTIAVMTFLLDRKYSFWVLFSA